MTKYCFIGLDIGRYEIFASIVSENREEIEAFQFPQTHEGYQRFIEIVHHLELKGLTPVVSAEGHDGNLSPLDEYLIIEGIVFKPLHPTAVSRYKEVLGQPIKTDAYDAYVIADLLCLQHQRIEPKGQHQEGAEFKSLSRTFKSLTKAKTQFANQLQAELMSYFPELLTEPVFSKITTKSALHLLCKYPTPEQIAALSLDQLTEFLASVSKNHIGEDKAKEILSRAITVNKSPVAIESKALIVSTLALQILAIDESLATLKKRIVTLGEASPTLMRLCSIAGVSFLLAARLIGELQTLSRFPTESKLAMFTGLAPIPQDSGKRRGKHKTAHRANKIAKDAMMQIAECNRRNCPRSKAYYLKQREAGKSHWQSLKCLARQLVRVLFALFRDDSDCYPKTIT
jgi:transposase